MKIRINTSKWLSPLAASSLAFLALMTSGAAAGHVSTSTSLNGSTSGPLAIPAANAVPNSGATDPVTPGARLHLHCEAIQRLPGAIGQSRAVHMDRDGRLDLLTRVGDALVFVSGPDPRQFSEDTGLEGVTAFTTVAVDGGAANTALVADTMGLARLDHMTGPLGQWSFGRQQIGPQRWAGAQVMVSVDCDGDGDGDLLGLTADGQTLLRMDRLPNDVWTEASDAPLGLPLQGLAAIQWTGSTPSLVSYLLDATGGDDTVVLMDLSGGIYSMVTPGGAVDQLIVLRDAQGPDSIAVLSGSSVTVIRADGTIEAPSNWSALAPSGASSADVNGDGHADLLLNSTVVDEVRVLFASADPAAGSRFDTAATATVSLELGDTDMSVQHAAPVAADFDGDGDVDVIQLVDATRRGVVGRSVLTDETAMHATLEDSDWILGSGSFSAYFSVALPPLPDGSAPDWLEVTLSSTVGAGGGRGVTSVLYSDVVNTRGSVVGDTTDMWIHLDHELGQKTSLLIRGLGDAPGGATVNRVGPEKAFGFLRDDDLTRGTNNGVDPISGDDVNTEDWPPLPPKPVTING